jgi:hypothetical protein
MSFFDLLLPFLRLLALPAAAAAAAAAFEPTAAAADNVAAEAAEFAAGPWLLGLTGIVQLPVS